MNTQDIYQNSDEISLKDVIKSIKGYFAYLFSRWKLLATVCVIGAVWGLVLAMQAKVRYRAVLTFALDEEKGGGGAGGLSVLASQFGFDGGGMAGGAFSSQNLLSLMKSRSVIERSLFRETTYNGRRTTLVNVYMDIYGLRDKLAAIPQWASVDFSEDTSKRENRIKDSIVGSIYERIVSPKNTLLSISQKDKKTSIFYIEVESINEDFSKSFAESLVQEISEFYTETKSRKARMNLEILQKQTDSVRAELYGAISGVAVVTDNTFNLNPAFNVMRVPSSKRQADIQANTAMLTQLVQNLELAKVTLRKETPLLQVVDYPVLPLKSYVPSKSKYALTGALLGVIVCSVIMGIVKSFRRYQV